MVSALLIVMVFDGSVEMVCGPPGGTMYAISRPHERAPVVSVPADHICRVTSGTVMSVHTYRPEPEPPADPCDGRDTYSIECSQRCGFRRKYDGSLYAEYSDCKPAPLPVPLKMPEADHRHCPICGFCCHYGPDDFEKGLDFVVHGWAPHVMACKKAESP